MLKSIVSIILTLFLGAGSIFFFYEYNFFIAVLLLVWFLSRLFGYNLKRLATGFGEITTNANLEKRCNCALEFNLNLESVLKHASVDRLLKQLQRKKIIDESVQKEDWIKTMLDNFKKTTPDTGWEKVTFNIKNNNLWKNGEIDFYDSVYHKIFIPYRYIDGKEEDNKGLLTPSIEVGLEIRLVLVNGLLKLQIGNFSKEYSPKVFNSFTYQTYATITTFPLMYFSYQHKIPENYLNLSSYATDSYKNLSMNGVGKKGDYFADWKMLCKEINDYNYVCSVADEYVANSKRWDTIISAFENKKKTWLDKEDFRDPFARRNDEDDYDSPFRNRLWYVNNYLNITVFNYGATDFKEGKEQYAFTDYYQERP